MNIKTEVARFVATKDIVTPYKTLEKASEEAADYDYLRAGTGHTICTHGDKAYAIIERGDEIGCSRRGPCSSGLGGLSDTYRLAW